MKLMKKRSLVLRSSDMEHFISCISNSVSLNMLYSAVLSFGNDPWNFISPNPGEVALENDSDCRKNILGDLNNTCVHGPQSSTCYSFLNDIDIALRSFCS